MKRFKAVFFGLVLLSASAVSQTGGWMLDKAHSKVTFGVKHMVISEVEGSFGDFDIAVNASKPDFTDGTVDGSIKVASINTENAGRDRHLKSDDFFNADLYPEIVFKGTSVEKTADGKYKIKGNLTIRDVTKPVTFDAEFNGTLQTSRATLSAWKATLALNRFDYGLKWNKTIETGGFVVGEMVTITLLLEFNKANT